MDTNGTETQETGDGPNAKLSSQKQETEDSAAASQPQTTERAMDHLSPKYHVPPYTGNVPYICAPSLESYMFTQTPSGSELCSWVTDPMSSTADLVSLSDRECGAHKQSPSRAEGCTSRINRREQASVRRQNALRALALEHELTDSQGTQSSMILIRFPDAEITSSIVTSFSKGIRDVILPESVAPRYCFVHLKPGASMERTTAEINKIRFGSGYLQAEPRPYSDDDLADNIDPCSLYVSNIPFNMATSAIRAHFPSSQRVDIGVIKREKRARYAFVRYANVDLAMEAFRQIIITPLNNRILTVRYRRLRKANLFSVRQQLTSSSALNAISITDEATECNVLSASPAEPITVSDSDSNCSIVASSSTAALSRTRKRKMQSQEDEICKLKARMSDFEKILKSIRADPEKTDNVLLNNEPPSNQTLTAAEARPITPEMALEIKLEEDFFGTSSPYKPTTLPTDNASMGSSKPKKSSACFGWLFSGLERRKLSKHETHTLNSDEAKLEELLAKLDSDSDA